MDLNIKIKSLGGVYKRYAPSLEKLGIIKLSDFLYHIPNRFEDFRNIKQVKDLKIGEIVTVVGTVKSIRNIYTKNYKKIQEAVIYDETGELNLIWFNQQYIVKSINPKDRIAVAGRIEWDKNKFKIISPDYEILNSLKNELVHTGRLVPIYPLTQGLSSKWIRRQTYKLITTSLSDDFLPEEIKEKEHLLDLKKALSQLHFPDSLDNFQKARARLAFDEIFILDLLSKKRKHEWSENLTNIKIDSIKYKEKLNEFIKNLPFELTNSQKTVINEMLSDLKNDRSMNRLLLGDVGSGKTIVAGVMIYLTYLNGYKSLFMAPTEVLANQHYQTLSNFLTKYGLKIGIYTGSQKSIASTADSTKAKNKKILNTKYSILDTDVVVGTHALISNNFNIPKLGFVVVDEQHRFGVEQRAAVRNKGNNPHFLSMSATPIPRTIVLTAYGDLDVSYLSDLPKGRKTIKTWLVPNNKRSDAYKWIEGKIKEGDQAFIICPFIEESESLTTIKAAKVEFENLKKIFPTLKLGLLHGKIKSKEKDKILNDFSTSKYDILVATPVVEVGIDIPNATIIIIEAAERFGLASLHQLRGRVGRGDKQSYCLLFSEATNSQARLRLKEMEKISSGYELAELDLRLRGGGDIYGNIQSGVKLLKIASFSDYELISKAKKAANEIWPKIREFPKLSKKLEEENTKQIMPD